MMRPFYRSAFLTVSHARICGPSHTIERMTTAVRNMSIAILILWILDGVAHGQTEDGFTGIPVKAGDTVTVVATDGAQITGRISEVARRFLIVAGQHIAPERALRIERVGDPIWNGVRNGALFGLAFFKLTFPGALIMNAAIDRDCVADRRLSCVVAMVGASAAIGGLSDKLRVGRKTVFLNGAVQQPRLSVAPRVGLGRVSVRASITWR
jgi:hypothetical protein